VKKQKFKSKGSKDFYPYFSPRRRGDFFGGEFERKLSEAFSSRVFALAAKKIVPEGTLQGEGKRGRFLLPPFLYRHKEKEVAIKTKPKAENRLKAATG